MHYKYQKRQVFGKRLKVPKFILEKIYSCTLSFNEFIEYGLDDKIPTSCIIDADRQIVEKFGIDKCKELDWELINKQVYYSYVNFRDLLMTIDSQTENINNALYELSKDKIRPCDYTSKMSKIYSNRLFNLSQEDDDNLADKKREFNEGRTSLKDLINNWDLFKDKDLSYCLLKERKNHLYITDSELKKFMISYKNLAPLIAAHNDIYSFIYEITILTSDEEKYKYIKKITDAILDITRIRNIQLTNEEYKQLFKYSSMEDYLKTFNRAYVPKIIEELETLPQDYVFNMSIPFSVLLDKDVLSFIGFCGLKNIVDFDNDCGHFFTDNNFRMLKFMDAMYLRHGKEELNLRYHENIYTKNEFYEVMRKLIIYGPFNDHCKVPSHRNITGEFRSRNIDLFISEQAPEELQKLFYTKEITPRLLVEHPEYIQYLNGKNLGSCFKRSLIEVVYPNDDQLYSSYYENFYSFLASKTDFNGVMNFITDYFDILDTLDIYPFWYGKIFLMKDDFSQIQKKINEDFRKSIIERRIIYPRNIPKDLIKNYPSMFLSSDAPQELQKAFYNRTISSEFILSNQSYREFLKDVDLEVLFTYMPVGICDKENGYYTTNLVNVIKQTFGLIDGFDVILLYGKYLEPAFEKNPVHSFKFNPNLEKSDLLDELDKIVLQSIIDGKIKYDENAPNHFKNNNPALFLGANVPQEFKDKFYNREFTLNDFSVNPKLLEMFGNTNIIYGFSENMSWISPLFNDLDDLRMANYNRLKVISAFSKISDSELKNAFKEYIMEFGNNTEIKNIEYILGVISRLLLSNSSEMFRFRKELATQILKSSNPLKSLSKIEEIFIKNNIPTVGKIYSCFEILHPDFQGYDFNNFWVSPVLKMSSTTSKKIIVFSDLIKASFGSNNRSVNTYLRNIEFGSNLYESIKSGQIQFDSLGEAEMRELTTFCNHLATLYNNTMKAKKDNEIFISTGNILTDILELSKKLSPNGTLDYNLADRVIRMFCGFAGIDTLEQAKEYINKKVKTADSRNRNASNSDMVLEQGDFIKGIGDITYLRNILQNGSLARDYLSANAGSDMTPLDNDVSMIISSEGTTSDKMKTTTAYTYGPIWFILKNDDRFIITRTSSGRLETKRDLSKMEVFYTGVHKYDNQENYGIRTGFASSEINYIVMENYDPRVGLEIAMNGFYIPVANKEGKIVFTSKDYDELRTKMSGLSYFGYDNYAFSENLITEETEYFAQQIEQSNFEVQAKREKITSVIKKSLDELGLHLKTNIDGDLSEGFVELIDTGSTGRGTNKPGDGDFDFMMRLDKNILSNPTRLNEIKQTILKNLGRENSPELTGAGDFRLKGVQIDTDMSVDIDITFTQKTDKVSYSTDMALQDRLATIQRTDPKKYKYVVANILLAKQVLKKAEAYKPNRGEIPQGGLGGVGIENWILQNGGSFTDAANSFLKAAEGKSFSEIQSTYQIWDFGDNYLAERRGLYSNDNFVANNMSEAGYQKMVQALKEYLKSMNTTQVETENIKK